MTAITDTRVAVRLANARRVYEAGSRVVALDDVDLAIEAGRFTAIMGPSGSGKSTLLHCLGGLDQLDGGSVLIGDQDLSLLDERELTTLRRTRIGFVFQAFNLLPQLTARENIVLPLALARRDVDHEVFADVVAVLGLKDRLDHRPTELSGGQQQRVAIARALVSEPDVLLGDEPTGNLDTRSGTEILAFFRRAVDERGQTTVMVTHDPNAAAWADRVVFLLDGRVHSELTDPTASDVLRVMKAIGDS